jgi:hypothetical protein
VVGTWESAGGGGGGGVGTATLGRLGWKGGEMRQASERRIRGTRQRGRWQCAVRNDAGSKWHRKARSCGSQEEDQAIALIAVLVRLCDETMHHMRFWPRSDRHTAQRVPSAVGLGRDLSTGGISLDGSRARCKRCSGTHCILVQSAARTQGAGTRAASVGLLEGQAER